MVEMERTVTIGWLVVCGKGIGKPPYSPIWRENMCKNVARGSLLSGSDCGQEYIMSGVSIMVGGDVFGRGDGTLDPGPSVYRRIIASLIMLVRRENMARFETYYFTYPASSASIPG